MSRTEPPGDAFTVLLVCTGNICRSALAERLGRAYLDEVLGERASQVRLLSAGTHAVVGSEMHPNSALVLRGLGGDPAGFVAQQLDKSMLERADVTLTLTRAHRRAVLQMAPRALARTFTLREAAAILGILGHPEIDGDELPKRARELVREMALARARHAGSDDDDVPDPINLPLEAHQEAGELIAAALIPLLERMATLDGSADLRT